MQINGIAHVQLTVNDFRICREFYKELFDFFEMKVIFDEETAFYGVGGRTGIVISPADDAHRNERFQQRRSGLHHICFSLRTRDDLYTLHEFLKDNGARIVHAPENGLWADGYYS